LEHVTVGIMQRIYVLIPVLCLFSALSFAQESSGARAVAVGVAAQMPASDRADCDSLMSLLASTGEEGVFALVEMMHAPGQGSNAQAEYALSALSHYVTEAGREPLRLTAANAYTEALNAVGERETKAFIIRQLQTVGKDESVDALAQYLNEETLSAPAARALAAIRTEKAGKALQAALLRRAGTAKTQRDIIAAIGEARTGGAETLLLGLVDTGDESFRKDVLYALSRTGGKASVKALFAAAGKAGFGYDRTNATEAYIALLKRLPANPADSPPYSVKETEKAAGDLLKKATKAGQEQTRIAALEILLFLRKEKGLTLVRKAQKDPSAVYRNAALNHYSPFADRNGYVELIKTMAKAKPETKADILNWLGRECEDPAKNAVIKNLDIRFDLPVRQVLTNQLKNENFAVKQAAVWVLVKTGDVSVIPVLADLLTGSDKEVIALGKEALAAFKGDVAPVVARTVARASDAGKIAAVELLALRRASANINTALELLKAADNPEVRKAAYGALKDVAAEKDLTLLCGMLETADTAAVPPLQQAVIGAIASLPAEEQIAVISRRRLQAGEDKAHLYDAVLSAAEKLKPIESFVLPAEEREEGYKILFDGTSMSEWTGNTEEYILQDGAISLIPGKGSGGNLYSKAEYDNFVLRFEFQLTAGANNGLGIRTPQEGDAAYVGMELQILDNEHPSYKDLQAYQYHGSVYGVIPARRGYLKPVGEWNSQEVTASGDHIKVILNGEVILDGNIREAAKDGTPDRRQHPGLFNKKGYIGFLGHGSPVKFRHIRIKELKEF
jgi:HEAT repeat protein